MLPVQHWCSRTLEKHQPTTKPNLSFSIPSFEDYQTRKEVLGLDYFLSLNKKFEDLRDKKRLAMAVPWGVTLWMARMVWLALSGWVTSCLTVADEIASSFRTGDIGLFHVG